MHRNPLLPVLVSVFALAVPAAAQFTPFEQALAEFDAKVARGVADDGAGCVSIAVFRGDRVLWSKGYGWADIDKQIPATAETIGRTGSITKSFTAVVMAQLVERGVLALDQPVVEHLPEFAQIQNGFADAPAITFRMLASHTGGLIREPELEGAASGSIDQWEEKILASIPKTRCQSAPGTEYSYSNIGSGILGLTCSRAAEVPFIQLVQDQILTPLGMESSTFMIRDPDHVRRLSVGYAKDRRTGAVSADRATREHSGRGYKVPNGGLYSTVGDLAKFAAAMMGESSVEILSAATRDEMLRPQAPAEAYGLGFQVREADGLWMVGHGGSVAGYNAGLYFDLESKVGVAMLRTTSFNPPIRGLLEELVASPPRTEGGSRR